MFGAIILAYFAYRNSLRAKEKGQNPVIWAFITITAALFFTVMGGMFEIFTFCKEAVNIDRMLSFDSEQRAAASQQLQQALSGDPIHMVTIAMFTIGGYLMIRFKLENEPVKQLKPVIKEK